jgi:hypothetical protein
MINAAYKLAKANRSYYKIKKATADYRIEKAKKHLDKVDKGLENAISKNKATREIFFSKEDTIKEGDNIFTKMEKLQKKNK